MGQLELYFKHNEMQKKFIRKVKNAKAPSTIANFSTRSPVRGPMYPLPTLIGLTDLIMPDTCSAIYKRYISG